VPTATTRQHKRKRSFSAYRPKTLRGILRLIPGYDPFATAGDCWLDEDAARLALDFFPEVLTHVKGEKAHQPFILEPWEQAIVGNLFGWKRPDGTRRYRTCLIFVARKNGKTPLAAGIILYVLFCDGEPGAEIYSAAGEHKQAALIFEHARGMVEHEKLLRDQAKIYETFKSIEVGSSTYRVISADAKTKHGFNTHLAVVDELHVQPDAELVDALRTSTGARRQPLIIYTTTSDYERESICNTEYDYACKVRDGILDDPTYLPVIYGAEKTDDWTKLSTWRKANPNLGVSLSVSFLREQCARAQATPSYENTFKLLHLNIKTEQISRWLRMLDWDACMQPLNPSDLVGLECSAGLDLSSTQDITALVLAFPMAVGEFALLPFFWIPGVNAVEREKRDRVPYALWRRLGLVNFTEGNSIDYRFIRQRINELGQSYKIQGIGYDPYNATHIATELGEEDGFNMIEFRQGILTMNEPSKEFERLVLLHKLRHGGNSVLRWMASNAAVKTDPSANIRPVKPDSKAANKVDGVIASIMAIALARKAPEREAQIKIL